MSYIALRKTQHPTMSLITSNIFLGRWKIMDQTTMTVT